jgi:hypothetical protein
MGLPDYESEEYLNKVRNAKPGSIFPCTEKEFKSFGKQVSDGSTASYYELPTNCKELQDLISAKNMNAQIGEIFRECYRYGQASHSDELRGIKKILFYANAELKRLENVDS